MNDNKLLDVPKIIETPKGKTDQDLDETNLKVLREMARI